GLGNGDLVPTVLHAHRPCVHQHHNRDGSHDIGRQGRKPEGSATHKAPNSGRLLRRFFLYDCCCHGLALPISSRAENKVPGNSATVPSPSWCLLLPPTPVPTRPRVAA